MTIYVVHAGVDLSLELFVSPQLEAAVAQQWERIRDREVRDTYRRALERRLEDLLKDCLDWDLKPPTAAQLSYATVVATKLGLVVPTEARHSRFHMAMFLEKHASKLKERNEGAEPGRPSDESQAT
jgi:hypothetical protein